jgi:hypothetical protein
MVRKLDLHEYEIFRHCGPAAAIMGFEYAESARPIPFFADRRLRVGFRAIRLLRGAPGQLMRRGITKDQLKIGETVVVEGFCAKDESNNASGGRITA